MAYLPDVKSIAGVVVVAVAVVGVGVGAGAGVVVSAGAFTGEIAVAVGVAVALALVLPGGILLVATVIRLFATGRYLCAGFLALATNWREIIWATDFFHSPELLPESSAVLPQWSCSALWSDLVEEKDWIYKLAYLTMYFIVWVPALAYRLSLKSTVWFWWPLVFLSTPMSKLSTPEELANTVKLVAQGKLEKFLAKLAVFIGLLGIASIYSPAWQGVHGWLASYPAWAWLETPLQLFFPEHAYLRAFLLVMLALCTFFAYVNADHYLISPSTSRQNWFKCFYKARYFFGYLLFMALIFTLLKLWPPFRSIFPEWL